jgi:lysophospholipase L1-like esterase
MVPDGQGGGVERPDDARQAGPARPPRGWVRRWAGPLALSVVGLLALAGGAVVVVRTVAGPAAASSVPVAVRPVVPVPPASAAPSVAPVVDVPWVRTWQSVPQPARAGTVAAGGLASRTARMRVHTSVGGSALRLTLSNVHGSRPLVVTAATVALPAQEAGSLPTARPGTVRPLTFAGRPDVEIPARGTAVSDPLTFDVPGHADLLVSLAFGSTPAPLTGHLWAMSTTWLSVPGDRTADVDGFAFTRPVDSGFVATAIDVVPVGRRALPTVVAFGDSITDGIGSTVDADRRWPDLLAARLPGVAVVNAGIGANQVTADSRRGGQAAVRRFGTDALGVPGPDAVVILEGINDIQAGARAGTVTAGLATLADRARARGVRVVLATLTPYGGRRAYSAKGERTRQAVNTWIRTRAVQDGHADVVVDLDAALRDPADPTRLAPAFDCGDRIHPNDAGYAVVAAAVEPALRAVLPLHEEPVAPPTVTSTVAPMVTPAATP